MVDPVKCTNFSRDQYHLEEFAIFSICVANKPALRIAKLLHDMLTPLEGDLPFTKLKKYDLPGVTNLIMNSRMGCHTMKGRGVHQLINKKLDLRTCAAEELEEVCGIGLKTSRFFLLHSRENQQCIPLDTHILKFLKDNGVKDVPSATPSSAKRYKELEDKALGFAKERNMKPAEFDLSVWREYSGNTVSAVTGESYVVDKTQSRSQIHEDGEAGGGGRKPVLLKAHRGRGRQSATAPGGGDGI